MKENKDISRQRKAVRMYHQQTLQKEIYRQNYGDVGRGKRAIERVNTLCQTCCQKCGEKRTLVHYWWEFKMMYPLGKLY